jgi:hypothetical protein
MADEIGDGLRVNDHVVIPRDELVARASRAGGAGGQHVNTSSTRIEIVWNVGATRALTDEYDFAARTAVYTDGVLELAGSLSLVDVRSDYQLRIPEGDWSTLGGYVFGRLGKLPKMGDRVDFPGGKLEVIAMDGRRVAGVRVHKDTPDKVAAGASTSAAAH